ncbi:MAG: polysaccharide biosynthesis tyrosine autokinase [Chitinophagaceae bacterium]|nr:polysaccharide biosynthesis tyrosine autokinase [Chitinophagaceae bacterium]MCW5926326.1 polysaccharide biosynthesis tyrosine autokinase [Chitinophagaceae bacterium]
MFDPFNAEPERSSQRKEFNLKEFFFKYLRYWPYLATGIAVALFLAFLYIRYSTPIYSARGALFIDKQTTSGSRGQGLDEMFMFSGNMLNLSNEQQILKSRPLLRRVVQSLHLQVSYYNKGNVRSSNIYGSSPFVLEIISLKDPLASFSLEIEAEEQQFLLQGKNAAIPYGGIFETEAGMFRLNRNAGPTLSAFESRIYTITNQPENSRAAAIAKALAIKQSVDQATILDIEYESDNVKLCRDVVNQVMKEYANMNVEEKREISSITMQFIDERLDTLRNELGGVETGLQQYREKNEVIDLGAQSSIYFGSLSEANNQLNALQIQNGLVGYLLSYIANPGNQHKIVPVDLGIQEPTLTPLLSQYNAQQLQRSQTAQSVGPLHSSLASADLALGELRDQIIEALQNVKKSYNITAQKLQEQINHSQANIRSVPAKAKNLLDIERQQKIKENLYLFLLEKREEAAISAAATIASSKPLEDAAGSPSPIKPNGRNVYLIALLAGILLPVATIFIMEMLNDKILEREEVVRLTSTPVVGEVGHGEETLVVQSGSRTVVAEQFRIMRTNIQYLINKTENPVVLVTSSVSGEGKSFVATNFGAALALTGKKTIILEFDIRKPRLLKGLNMEAAKGLSNYIIGKATLDEIILPVPAIPDLYVIGCGPIPPNPSELLLDPKVGDLFRLLKERFANIVIDTAPVGLVSDGFTLGVHADTSIYIVRQGYTLRRQLSMVEELYQKKRLPNMGLVVNDIQTQGRYKGYYGYGGGSYYGYGAYGYGYGGEYFEKTRKKKS